MVTLKTSESEMQALIKPYNLPQTESKSIVYLESYSNPKIRVLTSIKPIEAIILEIKLTS